MFAAGLHNVCLTEAPTVKHVQFGLGVSAAAIWTVVPTVPKMKLTALDSTQRLLQRVTHNMFCMVPLTPRMLITPVYCCCVCSVHPGA